MSSIAALDDAFSLAGQATTVRPSGIAHGPALGPVPADGAVVEDVLGRVGVVRGNGAIEQVADADSLQEGDFLVVAGGTATVVFADGSRLRIVDDGQVLLKHVPHDGAPDGHFIILAASAGHFQIVAGAPRPHSSPAIVVETPAALIHADRPAFAFRHAAAGGLVVNVVEGAGPDAGTVVVENDAGAASIADIHHRIAVAGPEDAPLVGRLAPDDAFAAPEASPANPAEPEAMEVSAGGVEGAFPGDPIVVAGNTRAFDLTPDPAPLQNPSLSGVLAQATSLPEGPTHHAEQIWLGLTTSVAPSATDAPAPKTLTGWEPLKRVWEVSGSASVSGEAPQLPYEQNFWPIKPTEQTSMAGLALAPEQRPTGELDLFFNLQLGSLARFTANPIEGSAIRTKLALSAGAELSFDFFFDAGDQSPRNDCGLFVIGDHAFKLSDVAATGRDGASGWRTFVYEVPTTGVFTIGFAALNDRVEGNPSPLYVDNVRVNRSFGGDYVVVDGDPDAGWRVVVEQPVLREDWLPTSEDTLVTTTARALLDNDTAVATASGPLRVIGLNREGAIGHPDYSSDGIIAYDPRGRFDRLAEGEIVFDTFRYEVASDNGSTTFGTVRVAVTGRNDAPTAVDDSATVAANAKQVTLDVLANDDDVDTSDILRVSKVEGVTQGAIVTLRENGQLVYNPGSAFNHLGAGQTATDSFRYEIDDGHGGTSAARVTVTVAGRNDAPLAHDDQAWTDEDSAVVIPVLANDTDPDASDILRVSKVEGVTQGAIVTLRENGQLVYNPGSAFNHLGARQTATDSFRYGAQLTLNDSGSLVYDSGTTWNFLSTGEQRFETIGYTVSDGHGSTDSAQVTITINGANDAPSTIDDSAVTDEDAKRRLAVLANDSDPDAGDRLSIRTIILQGPDGTPTLGSVRVNADNTLTYDPEGRFDRLRPGESAADTFQYVVDDGHGGRATSTVTITIHGVENPQPTPAQELLDSFDDPLVTPFSIQGLTAHFQLRGTGDLRPTFVPQDPNGHDLTALHPTHLGQMAVLEAGGSAAPWIESFLSNDVFVGDRPLAKLPGDVDHSLPNAGAATRTQLVVTGNDVVDGHVLLAFDWNFVANPLDRTGAGINDFSVFSITDGATSRVFELSDARTTDWGSSGWRTSVYDITHDFAFNAYGEIRLTVGFAVLNDANPSHPSHLLLDDVRLNRPLGADFELVSGAGGGAFEIYRQSPTALPDSLAAAEDARVTVTAQALLVNDFTARGIDASTLRITGIDVTDTQGVVTFANGQLAYDPRGRFDFLAQGQIGADTFRYALTDADGGTDNGEVTVSITGLNDAPVASLDTGSAVESGASITIDVLANDDDIDSDDDRGTLRIIAASAASGAVVTFAGAAGAGIVYHPGSTGAFTGLGVGETAIDTITYTIEDSHGARASASVSMVVAGHDDAPTTMSDRSDTDEDTPVTLTVLANDTDPDLRDRLSISAVNGTAVAPGASVALASGAIVIANPEGTLRYDPAAGFSHLARGQAATDTFSYTVADGHGGAGTATVSITVTGRNDAPIPGTDALTTDASTRLTVAASTLLSNDTDPDAGDGIALIGIDAGSTLGTVNFDGTTVTYDPDSRFRGLGEGETAADSFAYRIADHDGSISTGSVAVTIHGLNDAPGAGDDGGSTDEDTPVTLRVLANDTDPDVHDTLTVTSIDTSGTRGQVTLNADGSITYDPCGRFDSLEAGQTDHDSFTYRVSDGHGGTDDATVTVAISGKFDTERVVDSFETAFLSQNRTSSIVTTVGQYQETDGAHGLYTPTDGQSMARLEAYGTTAQKVGSETISKLENFLGIPDRSLPKDPVDNSFPANGSAFKLKVSVLAGDDLLVDNLRLNRDFGEGYQLVDHQADGRFETVVHT